MEVTKDQLIKEMTQLYSQIETQKKENGRLRFEKNVIYGDAALVNKLKAELIRARTQAQITGEMLETELINVAEARNENLLMQAAMNKAIDGANEAAEKSAQLQEINEALRFQIAEQSSLNKASKVTIESMNLQLAEVETAHRACPSEKDALKEEIASSEKVAKDMQAKTVLLGKDVEREKGEVEKLRERVGELQKEVDTQKAIVQKGNEDLKKITLERDKITNDKERVEAKIDNLLEEVRQAHLATNDAEDLAMAREGKILELQLQLDHLKSEHGLQIKRKSGAIENHGENEVASGDSAAENGTEKTENGQSDPVVDSGLVHICGTPFCINEFWDHIDTDKSGSLTSVEVWKAVQDGLFCFPGFFGQDSSHVKRMLDEGAEYGVISREEFGPALLDVLRGEGLACPVSITELWTTIDKDSNGQLDYQEIVDAVKSGLLSFVPEFQGSRASEIYELMESKSENGLITKQQFFDVMQPFFGVSRDEP